MPKSAGEMDMAAMHKKMGTEHHASHDEVKKKNEEKTKQQAQKMKAPNQHDKHTFIGV